MTPAERKAAEAKRLLNEPLLAAAFEAVMLNAMRELTTVDASDTKEILRLQAIACCLSDVRDALYASILASGEADGGVSVNERPA